MTIDSEVSIARPISGPGMSSGISVRLMTMFADDSARSIVTFGSSHEVSSRLPQSDRTEDNLGMTHGTRAGLMHLQDVPTAVISTWLGHASKAFTRRPACTRSSKN